MSVEWSRRVEGERHWRMKVDQNNRWRLVEDENGAGHGWRKVVKVIELKYTSKLLLNCDKLTFSLSGATGRQAGRQTVGQTGERGTQAEK